MKYILRAYDVGALLCFCGMMLCILIEVFSRNVLSLPTTWAEESSRLLCVWSVFLGAASAWRRGAHIVINVVVDRLAGRAAHILRLITGVLCLFFLAGVWIGTLFIMKISYPSKTTALEISISYFYLGLFLGVSGMLVFQLQNTWQQVRSLAGRRECLVEKQ